MRGRARLCRPLEPGGVARPPPHQARPRPHPALARTLLRALPGGNSVHMQVSETLKDEKAEDTLRLTGLEAKNCY